MKNFITIYGILDVFNNDEYNGKYLINGKIPDQDVIERNLTDVLLHSSTIINVGGGIGAHDLLFTRINPSISIYTFEPRDEYFCLLSKNISKNKIENVIIMNNALGHITGPVDFSASDCPCICDHEDIIEINLGSLISTSKTYHIITLDSLHLLMCDVLFIDLDGFAYMTLIGGIKTIKKFKPVICYRNINTNISFIKKTDTNTIKELLIKLEYSIIEDNDFIIAKPIVTSLESTEIQNLVNVANNFIPNV